MSDLNSYEEGLAIDLAKAEDRIDDLVKAAVLAQNTIEAIYQWVDKVEKAGGTTSIEGIAVAHAMFKSLQSNRSRLDKLITQPLEKALAELKGEK